MQTFPMFLTMRDRRVVIAGGGEQAAQKCRLILKTEAAITVAAPELEPELQGLADRGRILHHAGRITPALFADTALVFVATGCAGADAALHALAKAAGALVNVVDRPDLCDALTPSIVDRDPVVVAIGTEGTAPILGRQLKTRIEEILEPRLGELAAIVGRLRDRAAARLSPDARRELWRWVFAGTPRAAFKAGRERDAVTAIKAAIETGGAPAEDLPQVALVGAGTGSRDLITLRGVQRLQEADIIFFDRLIDDDVLELARRDAERVYVGKAPGCHAWPQDKINDVLVAAAKQGKRVVRLKCGDPGVFSRGAEEARALHAVGIPVEIVPGVTAASVAAAATGGFLTERATTDTLVFTTGTCRAGDSAPNPLDHLVPGACVAIYMGTRGASDLAQALQERFGLDAGIAVEVVSNAGTPQQTRILCDAAGLADHAARGEVRNPAIIFVRRPKAVAVSADPPHLRLAT
ncbi:MAG: siroheme synthase CysG [Pseudomonadota bacterium]